MRFLRIAAALAAAAILAGCATQRAPSPRDPLEPMNRAVFEFNDAADRAVFKPVAQGYRAVLPDVVRAGVRNFFSNLRDPWIAVNQLLQGKIELALSDSWRFIVNTTFGIGGVFDVAADMRLPKHNEDFGQTLAVWGLGDGPYLVIPIWGPSTARDGVGLVADAYAYLPWWIPDWLDLEHRVAWQNSLSALDFVNIRANLLDATNILEEAALDRYAFVRDAYFQRRRNLIYDGNPPPEPDADKASAAPRRLETESARESAPFAPAAGTETAPPAASGPQSDAAQVVDPKVPANYSAVLSAGSARVAAAR
ncbi:MAG TPA: MlaA family lipoprotein [Burkholderiales bacterium]|nr:MlaA family lipoprotein [Burkholderiales bacterium]